LVVIELLALGEKLALGEIGGLTSEETLLEAESHGLIATDGHESGWRIRSMARQCACVCPHCGRAASVCNWWRSSIPLRDFADAAALAILSLIALGDLGADSRNAPVSGHAEARHQSIVGTSEPRLCLRRRTQRCTAALSRLGNAALELS
jgi:hypothetical protein